MIGVWILVGGFIAFFLIGLYQAFKDENQNK